VLSACARAFCGARFIVATSCLGLQGRVACGDGYQSGSRECRQCARGYFPRFDLCHKCADVSNVVAVAMAVAPLAGGVVVTFMVITALSCARDGSPMAIRARKSISRAVSLCVGAGLQRWVVES
jgi:hypothetical protein